MVGVSSDAATTREDKFDYENTENLGHNAGSHIANTTPRPPTASPQATNRVSTPFVGLGSMSRVHEPGPANYKRL